MKHAGWPHSRVNPIPLESFKPVSNMQRLGPGARIDYEKYQWTSHLFDVEGSMVREITGRVSACGLWTVVVVAFHQWVGDVSITTTTHTLVGAALSLLLVFRTNSSYDRYWEGRKQWGSILNESRNLGRATRAFVAEGAPDLAEAIALWTAAFAHATKNSLRGTPDAGLGSAENRLPADALRETLEEPHTPTGVAARISEKLAEARQRGVISDYLLTYLDQNVQLLIDYLGACERIKKTPLPFVYVIFLRRALIIYCFSLPFALVTFYGWLTIPVTLVAAFTFFGIEEIGVEIENPFGYDSNDLPLEEFCQTIERDVFGVLGMPSSSTPETPAKAGRR
ncbi:MAG: bestrophin family protein [Isosphaeraceae bacterium]